MPFVPIAGGVAHHQKAGPGDGFAYAVPYGRWWREIAFEHRPNAVIEEGAAVSAGAYLDVFHFFRSGSESLMSRSYGEAR
jgi:hypothetical protein